MKTGNSCLILLTKHNDKWLNESKYTGTLGIYSGLQCNYKCIYYWFLHYCLKKMLFRFIPLLAILLVFAMKVHTFLIQLKIRRRIVKALHFSFLVGMGCNSSMQTHAIIRHCFGADFRASSTTQEINLLGNLLKNSAAQWHECMLSYCIQC